jgi:hypothetical protein
MKRWIVPIVLISLFSCKKDQIDQSFYLNDYAGIYTGTSVYSQTYPQGSSWVTITKNRDVEIEVSPSSVDSCLDFYITRSDTSFASFTAKKISINGRHESEWGGGSSYGSLSINFNSGKLHIYRYQKCGIPCTYTETFNADKAK